MFSFFIIFTDMNNSTDDWHWRRQQIWEEAENPKLGLTFCVVATIWLCLCIFTGVPANVVVIRAFVKNQTVIL